METESLLEATKKANLSRKSVFSLANIATLRRQFEQEELEDDEERMNGDKLSSGSGSDSDSDSDSDGGGGLGSGGSGDFSSNIYNAGQKKGVQVMVVVVVVVVVVIARFACSMCDVTSSILLLHSLNSQFRQRVSQIEVRDSFADALDLNDNNNNNNSNASSAHAHAAATTATVALRPLETGFGFDQDPAARTTTSTPPGGGSGSASVQEALAGITN